MKSESLSHSLPQGLLTPLCNPFCRHADCLLDLYEMTQSGVHPGRCVRCFYRLLHARPSQEAKLRPLKQWIETHVEVCVHADQAFAGTIPIQLEEEDLESFCQKTMLRCHRDRHLHGRELQFSFRLKQNLSA